MPGAVGWWWFTAEKQGTSDPSKAIIFACKIGKIFRSKACGQAGTWQNVTPTTYPPNTFSQTPAPTAATVTYVQRVDNIHRNGWHCWVTEYDDGTLWGGWLLVTTDDCLTYTWYPLEGAGDLLTDGSYYYARYENLTQQSGPGVVTISNTGNIGLPDGNSAVLELQDSGYKVYNLILQAYGGRLRSASGENILAVDDCCDEGGHGHIH